MGIKVIKISEEQSILEAMEQMNRTGSKVLFIEKKGRLSAAVSDGDIRRWILKTQNLDTLVKNVANYNPKFLYIEEKHKANEYMRQYGINAIPIVDERMAIVSIAMWNEENTKLKNTLNIPVVIMAGGLGTRLYPYTKILPKPLIPVGEIPIAQIIIEKFQKEGCTCFYMIINHMKNMIKAYFNELKKDYRLTFIEEKEFLGTGGGLSLLKGQIHTPFILTNCDILIDADFREVYDYHLEQKNSITMICSMKNYKIPYGVIEMGNNGEIRSIREKPGVSFLANTGCYLVEPKIIEAMEDTCKIDFPDIIENLRNKQEKVGVYPISEYAWMDMGQLDGLEQMKKRLNSDYDILSCSNNAEKPSLGGE
ncbi:MAG: CBS domain-containing protein [Clostridiaceae bacterium]|jgi:dTDP-glucose pyrophosphorylase|nr:CBS domain-containing protein [Clostridiaceae bacterium]